MNEIIAASALSTSRLQSCVLRWTCFTDTDRMLWDFVCETPEAAKAYMAETLANEPERAREEAASALVRGGWDLAKVCRKLS